MILNNWKRKISNKQKLDNKMIFAKITPILLNSEEAISNSSKSVACLSEKQCISIMI